MFNIAKSKGLDIVNDDISKMEIPEADIYYDWTPIPAILDGLEKIKSGTVIVGHAPHLNKTLEKYRKEIQKLVTDARVEKAKRNAQSITLIDNDRYHVSVPLNYGACYVFNHQTGHQSTFCTGSSTGITYFKSYSENGPLIDVIDKNNTDTVNGKWQIHGPSRQITNSDQSMNSDKKFAQLFPGLMTEIAKALMSTGLN